MKCFILISIVLQNNSAQKYGKIRSFLQMWTIYTKVCILSQFKSNFCIALHQWFISLFVDKMLILQYMNKHEIHCINHKYANFILKVLYLMFRSNFTNLLYKHIESIIIMDENKQLIWSMVVSVTQWSFQMSGIHKRYIVYKIELNGWAQRLYNCWREQWTEWNAFGSTLYCSWYQLHALFVGHHSVVHSLIVEWSIVWTIFCSGYIDTIAGHWHDDSQYQNLRSGLMTFGDFQFCFYCFYFVEPKLKLFVSLKSITRLCRNSSRTPFSGISIHLTCW